MADVYDFRVLLLEILTGKVPTQPLRVTKGVDLPAWVRSVAREESTAKVFYVEVMRGRLRSYVALGDSEMGSHSLTRSAKGPRVLLGIFLGHKQVGTRSSTNSAK
ncbi:hypothetical protein NL676_035101 [Syzygium grande]|nr:hypothetical protein NL676_035101 [Syzygium grande]